MRVNIPAKGVDPHVVRQSLLGYLQTASKFLTNTFTLQQTPLGDEEDYVQLLCDGIVFYSPLALERIMSFDCNVPTVTFQCLLP